MEKELKKKVMRWWLEDLWITIKHPSSWWGIRHIGDFVWFLRAWFSYAPVLWNDMDVDWGEAMDLLEHKFKRMKKHFETCPYHADREKLAEELSVAIETIKRVKADNYFIDEWVAHFEKWEKKPVKEIHNDEEVYCYPSMSDEERLEWEPLHQKTEEAKEKDWHDLFFYLEHRMRSWWC